MQLDPPRKRKKHETLTQQLLERAASLEPGERFPSQSELMRAYRVSDRTVLRSLDDLRRAGWIVRRHGSGTFVTRPDRAPAHTPLRENRSTTVAALALTATLSGFYQACLDRLSRVTADHGWSLVCQHAAGETGWDAELPLESLAPRGFIIFNYRLNEIARRLQQRGHRTVILGTPPVDTYPDVPCVHSDHEQGGYVAAHHLVELGHRRIAFARISPDDSIMRSPRWRGHQRALREAERAGDPVAATLLARETIEDWRGDPARAAGFFRQPDSPTAVAVWNDAEALDLLRILQAGRLRVPEELSVVGYDALPEGQDAWPTLTTVDQHLDSQLRSAVDLLSHPTTPPPGYQVVVVPRLLIGGSSGPPPA